MGELLEHEKAVEQSRVKLSEDLAILCSPETRAAFTDDLKHEALDIKDALWEKLKARAASNPAAVTAIGAGLIWHLLRNPPITALPGRAMSPSTSHAPAPSSTGPRGRSTSGCAKGACS